ncbi:MAG: hypothetical protein WBW41_15320 [Verrucomicrobiia bacterium]
MRGHPALASGSLTQAGPQFLALSVKLTPFGVAIRFLIDFPAGGTYLKVYREGHNLDRCQTQFNLVESIEQQQE